MKINLLQGPIQSISTYFKDVVAKKQVIIIKKAATKVQEPSTQAILDRDPSQDAAHFNRPLVNAQLKDSEIDWSRWSIDNINHVETIRRRFKNSIGQSGLNSVSTENRIIAIKAFFEAGNANLSAAELETLTKYYAADPDADTKKAFDKVIERAKELVKVRA